jgi:hypothetical protein
VKVNKKHFYIVSVQNSLINCKTLNIIIIISFYLKLASKTVNLSNNSIVDISIENGLNNSKTFNN